MELGSGDGVCTVLGQPWLLLLLLPLLSAVAVADTTAAAAAATYNTTPAAAVTASVAAAEAAAPVVRFAAVKMLPEKGKKYFYITSLSLSFLSFFFISLLRLTSFLCVCLINDKGSVLSCKKELRVGFSC